MDRSLVVLERLREERTVRLACLLDRLEPHGSLRPLAFGRSSVERAQRLAAVSSDCQVHVAVAPELLGEDVDLDQLGARGNESCAAATREQAEPCSEHQNDVCVAAPRLTRGGEISEAVPAERVIRRDHAVGLGVREDRRADPLRKAEQLRTRTGEPGPAADQDRGTLRTVEQRDCSLHRFRARRGGGVGQDLRRLPRARLVDA